MSTETENATDLPGQDGNWTWRGKAPYLEDDNWFTITPNGGFDLSDTGFAPDVDQMRVIAAVLEHLANQREKREDEFLTVSAKLASLAGLGRYEDAHVRAWLDRIIADRASR